MLDVDTSWVPTFDMTDAAAVAINAGANRGLSSRATVDQVEDFSGFVKILDDGRVVSALDWHTNDDWTPGISFLTKGEDGSVYIGFDMNFYYFSELVNKSVPVQFIRVYPDSTLENTHIDIIWPLADAAVEDFGSYGQIYIWNNEWLDQEPLVKGPNGDLYFRVDRWEGFDQGTAIYKYDPDRAEVTRETPTNVRFNIEQFVVDGEGRLIFTENSMETSEYMMRFYSPSDDELGQVFTSSDPLGWVRGFTTAPDGKLLINGNGIQGKSGLVKVHFSKTETAVESIETIYPTSVNYYDFVRWSWYEGIGSSHIIKENSDASYSWVPELLNMDDTLNREALRSRISNYFMEPESVIMGTALATYFDTHGTDMEQSFDTYSSLKNCIESYPKEFVSNYFTGSQTFSDYLTDKGMENFSLDCVGSLRWLSDGSLVAVGDSGWWGNDSSLEIYYLLGPNGERNLRMENPSISGRKTSMIKYIGDVAYYRWAYLNENGVSTGTHNIGSFNMLTGEEKIAVLPESVNSIEIRSYDVADDNSKLYVLGLDYSANKSVNGTINLATGEWNVLDTPYNLSDVTVIE